MEVRPAPLPEARRILDLARRDRRAATQALGELSVEEQVVVVCEAPLVRRAEILELTPAPESVIPLLPEAELCFTAKAVGLHDASWILEHATPEQMVTAVDLDAWQRLEPDPRALDEWMAALAEAGPEPLLRVAQSIDPELVVLYLREHVEVILKPAGDDAQDWQDPVGGKTIEGQFYLVAKREGEDLEPIMRLLETLFTQDYWLYYRMLQGVIWELPTELAEWALRWRTGRLEDLGFPSWDDAMRIYGYVRPDRRAELPEAEEALQVSGWDLPVWAPQLPAAHEAGPSLFRALAELEDEERRAFFYAFIALANKVAVADSLPLGDAETTPRAIEKAAELASRGLEHLVAELGIGPTKVLRRATLVRLFQVGASLDREGS